MAELLILLGACLVDRIGLQLVNDRDVGLSLSKKLIHKSIFILSVAFMVYFTFAHLVPYFFSGTKAVAFKSLLPTFGKVAAVVIALLGLSRLVKGIRFYYSGE
ncbi:MAG: hypothetical protein OQK51_16470 [Kangiellaceae bacterium]|nr:hypothetical protein [Kangiellaceae bacterium]